MPSEPTVAWMDGALVPFERATVPLEDRGLQFGESLYEVIAVTGAAPRMLAEHGARMRAGAEELGIGAGAPTDAKWEQLAGALIEREGLEEGLLYAQLTGGSTPRSHVPAERPSLRFFAYLRPHRFPRWSEVARGIRAITLPDPRWARCDLKTTMLLPAVLAKREAKRRGATEAIFLGPGSDIREGASSNVLAVERGTLVTPLQTQHLLPGITRPLIGRLAGEAGLELRQAQLPLRRLLAADEVFVVSTALLVMPVLAVDDRTIGSGEPGPIATDLARRLRAHWALGS